MSRSPPGPAATTFTSLANTLPGCRRANLAARHGRRPTEGRMSVINRKFFFDRVRANLFAGSLKQSQVEGMTYILDVWEAAHAAKDDRWLAYALATTFHETAFTMKPISERGGKAYFFRRYDKGGERPSFAVKALGNTQAGDGALFHGRGFVQLTGRRNYAVMGRAFDVDLTSDAAAADRALEKELAARIMFKGMEDGIFTGKAFGDYFDEARQDWKNARRIINGRDRAEKIAGYGREFYGAISYTTGG
jgi:hypothetical protein